MTSRWKQEEFAIVNDYEQPGTCSLAVWDRDMFWFSDGDAYSPDNLELAYGADVAYLTHHQLECKLFASRA